MKKLLFRSLIMLVLACNVNVDEENNKDSATGFDSFVQKADTTLERWGDSAKERYKDVRNDVKDHVDDDSKSK